MHEDLEQDYEEEHTHVEQKDGPFRMDCAFCKGTGVHPATMKDINFKRCPACDGKGSLEFKGKRSSYSSCSKCGGTGREPNDKRFDPCHVCGGHGLV